MRTLTVLGIGCIAWLGIAACGSERDSTPDVSASKVGEETREAYEAAGDYAFQKREEYRQASERYLDELDRRIDALEARADRTAEGAEQALRDDLEALRQTRARAENRLDELASATAETWEEAKASLSRMIEEIERSLEQTAHRQS